MEGTLSRLRPEQVGQFTMNITTAQPSPDAEQRWTTRAEALAGWLVATWRRDQAQGEELVIDGQRPSDAGGDIRGPDLN